MQGAVLSETSQASAYGDEPGARVTTFIADFHQEWARVGQPGDHVDDKDLDDFDAWGAAMAGLVEAHFVAGSVTGSEGVMSDPPEHDPATEQVVDVQIDGDRATVRSVRQDGGMPRYFEYRLQRTDGVWRIARVLRFLAPPGKPLVDPGRATRLLASATSDAPLAALDEGDLLDIPSLFEQDREVQLWGESIRIDVRPLGTVSLPSGVVAVRDFGYGNYALEPLARRIEPGTYRAEVSTTGPRNAALRLLLSDEPAVQWRKAAIADGWGIVGVDAGNVAIHDLAELVASEAQHVDTLFEDQAAGLQSAPGVVFSIGGKVDDAVMVTSGYGDGAYPCYWGLAADGSLASLVVDFLVLAEDHKLLATVPLTPGHHQTDAGDLTITADGAGFEFALGSDVEHLRVLNPGGEELIHGDDLGLTVSGDRHIQNWQPDQPAPPRSVVEITTHLGIRHI